MPPALNTHTQMQVEGRTLGAEDEFGTLRVILSTRQETPGCATLDAFTRTLCFSHTGREVRDDLLGSPVPMEPRILHLPGQASHPNSQDGLAPHGSSIHLPIIPLTVTNIGPPKGTGLAQDPVY